MTNRQLQEMARTAKEHWLLDEDTDPHGDVARGLDHIAADGEFDQDVIDANVASDNDWDALQDWATRIGQQIA